MNTVPTDIKDKETPIVEAGENTVASWDAVFSDPSFVTGVGVAAAAASIAASIKALNKTIKGRFQKCVKTLFKMQKKFAQDKNGLDMQTVMGEKGNFITKLFKTDTWARWILGNSKLDKATQIGVYPFVKMYRKEIRKDYENAIKYYNVIADAGNAKNDSSESTGASFSTFSEALKRDNISETGETATPLNEVAITSSLIAMGLGAGIKYLAGNFVFNKQEKDKEGNIIEVGDPRQVQVTKGSTREICLAIIGNFMEKYVNAEAVMSKMGLDADTLSDVNLSSYDKFRRVIISFRGSSNPGDSRQYARMQKAFSEMVDNYAKVGTSIIKNFVKYSKSIKTKDGKDLSEKDANLLAMAEMKLNTAWSQQITSLKDNFNSVATGVIASPEYMEYYNFIVEKVLPVFKSGLAGDADYVLDVYPKAGDYFFIRQTQQQAELQDGEQNKGNVGLCKVYDYNKDSNVIKIKILARITSDIHQNDDGSYDTSDLEWERKSYNRKEEIALDFKKWIALDPKLVLAKDLPSALTKTPDDELPAKVALPPYKRTIVKKKDDDSNGLDVDGDDGDEDEYIFAIPDMNEARSIEEPSKEPSDTATDDANIEYKEDIALNEAEPQQTMYDTFIVARVPKGEPITNLDPKKIRKVETKNKADANYFANSLEYIKYTAITDDPEKEIVERTLLNAYKTAKEVIYPTVEQFLKVLSKTTSSEVASPANPTGTKKLSDVLLGYVNNIGKGIMQLVGKLDESKFKQYGTSKNNLPLYKFLGVNNKDFVVFDTKVKDNRGNTVKFFITPLLEVDEKKNKFYKLKLQFLSISNKMSPPYTVRYGVDVELADGIRHLIGEMKKEKLIESSISVSYSDDIGISESLSSISITRNIRYDKISNPESFYILVESKWGDGTVLDTEKVLDEQVYSALKSMHTFEDVSKYVKNNSNASISPLKESYTSSVYTPYNRFGMLTEGNPLYESIVLISFDDTEERRISKVYNTGVHKVNK